MGRLACNKATLLDYLGLNGPHGAGNDVPAQGKGPKPSTMPATARKRLDSSSQAPQLKLTLPLARLASRRFVNCLDMMVEKLHTTAALGQRMASCRGAEKQLHLNQINPCTAVFVLIKSTPCKACTLCI